MRNFQGIIFRKTQTHREIFKSALVYLQYERKKWSYFDNIYYKLRQAPQTLHLLTKLLSYDGT